MAAGAGGVEVHVRRRAIGCEGVENGTYDRLAARLVDQRTHEQIAHLVGKLAIAKLGRLGIPLEVDSVRAQPLQDDALGVREQIGLGGAIWVAQASLKPNNWRCRRLWKTDACRQGDRGRAGGRSPMIPDIWTLVAPTLSGVST